MGFIQHIRDRYLSVSLVYSVRILWAYKDFFRCKFPFVMRWYIKRFTAAREAQVARLCQKKEPIEVAFFLTIPGMWKSDYLFRLMRSSGRYHPYVVVYPYSIYKNFDKDECWKTVQHTRRFIEEKGFECRVPYDEASQCWLDPKKVYNPDVVIFSTTYKDMPKQFYVYNFEDKITCYIPYGYSVLAIYNLNYNLPFDNLVGYHFLETDIHRQLMEQHSTCKASNAVIVGYPGADVFLDKDYVPSSVWKPQSCPKKKVIWAPHHTIGDTFNLSNFLSYAQFMVSLAQKYQDRIQFAFKPHQLLKFKLEQLWGVEKTNAYYKQWADMPNTQLEEGGYTDLFITSDAMIHDCGSFTAEYMHTHHPVMYLVKDGQMNARFSPFGKMLFDLHYHGANEVQIESFLTDVVLSGNDPLKPQREAFFSKYLGLPNGKLSSQRVLDFFDQKFNRL